MAKGRWPSGGQNKGKGADLPVDPAAALVIFGLLQGFLTVDSVLVDADRQVAITLTGTLREKTTLDRVMGYSGDQPFDAVLQALLRRG
ncbi:MAG: hypothetical protein PHC60_08325 [Heliobacteriaceae bacterium]|nr:hypothetical protein [Heliobacteriaceae bacterium]MDD4588378.1 hypothetical protein [Heliobacteriaceae bacterium]